MRPNESENERVRIETELSTNGRKRRSLCDFLALIFRHNVTFGAPKIGEPPPGLSVTRKSRRDREGQVGSAKK